MKIAYFITGLGLGGAEIITIDLAQKAVRAGHEVIVVYLTDIDTLAPLLPIFLLCSEQISTGNLIRHRNIRVKILL